MSIQLPEHARETPPGWKVGTLGDLCRPRPATRAPAMGAHVGIEDMVPDRRYARVSESPALSGAKARCHRGDVLFSGLRPRFGKVNLADRDGSCSADILVLVPNDDLEPEFLLYVCQSRNVIGFAIAKSGGIDMPRTSWHELRRCPIFVPPEDERVWICGLLVSIDEAIEETERTIVASREVARAMAWAAFRPVGEVWHTARLKDLAAIPLRNGVFRPSAVDADRGGVPIIRPPDVFSWDGLDVGALARVEATDAEVERFGVGSGDCLFLRSSIIPDGIGRSILVRATEQPILFDCHLARFCPDVQRVSPHYLWHYCQTEAAERHLRSTAKASRMTTIDHGALGDLPIPIPATIEEQISIARDLEAVDEVERTSRKSIAALEVLRREAIEDLLSGRCRVLASARRPCSASDVSPIPRRRMP